MKRFLLLICSLFSISNISCKRSSIKAIEISPTEMRSFLDSDSSIQLIDVRTPKEYEAGFIENSQNINLFSSSFKEEINRLDKGKSVFIYCRSGKRSRKSLKYFYEAGFSKIYDLKGGFLNWKSEGYKIVKN